MVHPARLVGPDRPTTPVRLALRATLRVPSGGHFLRTHLEALLATARGLDGGPIVRMTTRSRSSGDMVRAETTVDLCAHDAAIGSGVIETAQ